MPEGDTIHKLAHNIGEWMLGDTVEELTIRQYGAVTSAQGQQIVNVEARGKHLLIGFSHGLTLRVHLGLTGYFRKLDKKLDVPKARYFPVQLITSRARVVCGKAKQVEVIATKTLASHRQLSQLGPDLLAPEFSWPPVWQLFQSHHGGRTIAEVLLDQKIAAGIGNVYKSEVLFLQKIHPFVLASKLTESQVRKLYELSRELLQLNLNTPRRITFRSERRSALPSQDPRYWVYGRMHKQCMQCSTTVEMRRQGDDARSTYFCPTCQPLSEIA